MRWAERMLAAASRAAGTNGAILCFHGLEVASQPSHSSMHVTLTHFENIVAAIRAMGTIVSLRVLVDRHLAGRSTKGLIALTADDAYVSWLAAERSLKALSIPLTIFAVSEALSGRALYWWDRIETAAALATQAEWHRFQSEFEGLEEFQRGQGPDWGPTRPLRQWILARHAGRLPERVDQALRQLESQLGSTPHQRSMTTEELVGFASIGGVDVGVHTASHPMLPGLNDSEILDEISRGYLDLKAVLPGTQPLLAVPFGLFDPRTNRLAREAGMTAALTLEGIPLGRRYRHDFGIPRLCVVREQSPTVIAIKSSRLGDLKARVRFGPTRRFPDLPSATT